MARRITSESSDLFLRYIQETLKEKEKSFIDHYDKEVPTPKVNVERLLKLLEMRTFTLEEENKELREKIKEIDDKLKRLSEK